MASKPYPTKNFRRLTLVPQLARIATALEAQNLLLRQVLEHNDYRFKEWMNRKFGKATVQSDFINPDDTEETP